MSKLLNTVDFYKYVDRIARSYAPATYRQQQAWMADWKDALGRLKYVDFRQADVTQSIRAIIRLRGDLRQVQFGLEAIEKDVESLWNETAAECTEAAHAFFRSEASLECAFIAVDEQDSFITGSLVLRLPSVPDASSK